MRVLSTILISALLAGPLAGQEEGPTATEKLKDSIREWIETTREIQKQEDEWDRDREVLQAHRDGLQTEIKDLTEQIEAASGRKGEADTQSLKAVEKYDALKAANAVLEERILGLEAGMLARIELLPPMLLKDSRVAQMVSDLRAETAKGKENKGPLNTRLNTVLNLLGAAEQFQSTIHLDSESRPTSDGRELKINMVYYGLAVAYGVDDAGEVGFIGKPGPGGWVFEERNDLAPTIRQLVSVMNGDVDAQFTTLPIDLP